MLVACWSPDPWIHCLCQPISSRIPQMTNHYKARYIVNCLKFVCLPACMITAANIVQQIWPPYFPENHYSGMGFRPIPALPTLLFFYSYYFGYFLLVWKPYQCINVWIVSFCMRYNYFRYPHCCIGLMPQT